MRQEDENDTNRETRLVTITSPVKGSTAATTTATDKRRRLDFQRLGQRVATSSSIGDLKRDGTPAKDYRPPRAPKSVAMSSSLTKKRPTCRNPITHFSQGSATSNTSNTLKRPTQLVEFLGGGSPATSSVSFSQNHLDDATASPLVAQMNEGGDEESDSDDLLDYMQNKLRRRQATVTSKTSSPDPSSPCYTLTPTPTSTVCDDTTTDSTKRLVSSRNAAPQNETSSLKSGDESDASSNDFLAMFVKKSNRQKDKKPIAVKNDRRVATTAHTGDESSNREDYRNSDADCCGEDQSTQKPRVARNPFAQAKAQEALERSILLDSPSLNKARSLSEHDNLWSDDEELPVTKEKKRNKCSTKQMESSSPSSMPNSAALEYPPDKSRKKCRQSRSSSANELEVGTVGISSDQVIDIDAEQLYPELSRPRFPVGPLEPLVLGKVPGETEEQPYQVPASIRRYLPAYQQQGIQFLFERGIQIRRGAILGDGMCFTA